VKAWLSSANGERFTPVELKPSQQEIHFPLTLNGQQRYQTHLGFGGSLTEAAAYTIKENHDAAWIQQLIALYYGPDGLQYNWTRIHMNSSDFALGNYTYVDYGDQTLTTFSIDREKLYVLPVLKVILQQQPQLNILVSPWSPPGWMKDNQQMNHGGSLLPEFAPIWAHYYVKFIQALQTQGIQPWGVTVQNEPAAKQVWDSCLYTAQQERDFIKHHLGPSLKQAFGEQIKLLVWDHNRDIMVERVKPIYEDPEASRYVWGTGFHWYGEEAFAQVGITKQRYPDKHLLFTEGCIEGGPRPGVWETGQRYARNIIGDLLQGNEGFIDWNLVLNEQGGPNHVGNFCDAPILFDRRSQKLILNSSYYTIGHFSKWIVPGSVRVGITSPLPEGVIAVAYQRPDQQYVIVLLNTTMTNQTFSFKIGQDRSNIQLPNQSIMTILMHEKELS
jgi:glucosylceramidase